MAWWSIGFAATFVVLMGMNLGIVMHLPEQSSAWARTGLLLFGFAIIACAVAAFSTAIFAIVKRGERSWLIWLLPILVGCYMKFMLLGEFVAPH